MSVTTALTEAEEPTVPTKGRRRQPRRRRRIAMSSVAAVAVAALAAGGATIAGIGPLRDRADAGGRTASTDSPAGTELSTVTKQALSERAEEDGTLGYAGEYTVANQAMGTYTALPEAGQVIEQGKVLYQVNGVPVVLLRGSVPAYRALTKGMTGPDVQQLNAALVALGLATSDVLAPDSDEFSSATVTALKKLQKGLDLDQTGALPLGQVAFLPSAKVRITSVSAMLGTQAGPGSVALKASSTGRAVVMSLDASRQSEFTKGQKVTITMPDGRTTPGEVSSISKVATDDSSDGGGGGGPGSEDSKPTIAVTITPTRPADTGSLDEGSVTVTIVGRTVKDVLAVPVNALLALAGGGYAVEVDREGTRSLVPVTLGLFDDDAGLVEVTGTGLAVGQRVVVPAS